MMMTRTETAQLPEARFAGAQIWPWLPALAVAAAYTPTFMKLIDGPWQTEQEGHGPLIIAACLWLVWSSRGNLRASELRPAPVAGWLSLVVGLAMLFLARTQDLISIRYCLRFRSSPDVYCS